MAATTAPEKKTKSDPPSVPADGDLRFDDYEGKRPDRHYVIVDKATAHYGVDYFTARGYEIETARAGGPRARIGRPLPEGAPVTGPLGTVLMSAPIEVYQRAYDAQQAQADAFDRAILRPGGTDALRGARGLKFENSTAPNYIERSGG